MERFYRANLEQSAASSLYSNDSTKRNTYSEYAESTNSTSSRPISFTPSYMNTIPPRKPVASKRIATEAKGASAPVQPVELPTARSPPSVAPLPVAKGLLLIAIAATPHPSTISYVEMMLKRGSYSGIAMIGNTEQETELRQLKMNIYASLGRLSLEVGVQLELQKAWNGSDISTTTSKLIKDEELVNGVLCCPSYDGSPSISSDLLSLDEDQLQWPWKYSVGFLHNTARSVLPKMRPKLNLGRVTTSYFLVTEPTETTALSQLYETACENIVTQLAETNDAPSLTIAYAQDILIPEPEPLKTNDGFRLSSQTGPVDLDPDVGDFAAGESPTRLWNMWAMQDELDTTS